MKCREAWKVHDLLTGELAAGETTRTMDHLRDCAECRTLLGVHQEATPTSSRVVGITPRYERVTIADVEAARERQPRTRARGLIAMAMVIFLTWVAISTSKRRPSSTSVLDRHEVEVAASLATGRPFPVGPRGMLKAWPRQFLAALPEGATGFTVRISRQGLPLWERAFMPGVPGVFLDPETVNTEAGIRHQIAGTAPFPVHDELGLTAAEHLTYWIILESGISSEAAEIILPSP